MSSDNAVHLQAHVTVRAIGGIAEDRKPRACYGNRPETWKVDSPEKLRPGVDVREQPLGLPVCADGP